jgi:hypothetical protein
MNRKMLLWAAVVLFAAVGISYAASGDVFMGTWNLNEAKSKMAAGSPKNSTVTYTMSGDNITCTIDGTDANGQPSHSEWTGKFDGKDYPVTGDPTSDMRSYKMVNSHTLVATGKSRTVIVHGMDANGMKTTSTEVYDKQ